MQNLREILQEAEKHRVAVGHFNISELSMLKAIFEVARKLNLPVIIGVSEGEREFIGVRQAVALIKSLRNEYDYPIFLNADHTHSLEKVEEAAKAGYDAILFDGGALSLEENIKQTKMAVAAAKKINPDVLIEGELGFIGSGSVIRKELPKGLALSGSKGAAIKPEDLTKPEDAQRFVKETGVDFLAPAAGNIHGMFANAPEPTLNIERIRKIKSAAKIPLVLHGGSGNTNEDFLNAIKAGVNIIHISTELRLAWRRGLERGLRENPEEIAPYKILTSTIEVVARIVEDRLKLFNKLT